MTGLSRVPTGRAALARQIDLRGTHRRDALRARISAVIETLTCSSPPTAATKTLLELLESALTARRHDHMWLALAVISGRLPAQDDVQRAVRIGRLDGALAALAETLTIPPLPPVVPGRRWPTVRVVTRRVLVDIHDTARTDLATGIQRVARQTTQRWQRDHDVTLVGWTRRYTALRELSAAEQARALGLDPRGDENGRPSTDIVVPWNCEYVLPELSSEPVRNSRLQSLFRFSGNEGVAIGFDLVPLTSAETTAEGMGHGFSTALAAASYSQRIAAISNAAATEYQGWREMLAGAGLTGPQIKPIALATEVSLPTGTAIDEARELLCLGGLPMVLCVGSHEPRKNHLAVLHAAELLWREGLTFSLAFIGGNSWRGERFVEHCEGARARGRPIVSVRALPDELLWAAYRLAHCLIFPSLNEGFGLPVAESLSLGTPVITSSFGSMKELGAMGGALFVDPRDDHDIADRLRQMLVEPDLHERLAKQAADQPTRTWDQYAVETWKYLVGGSELDLPMVGV